MQNWVGGAYLGFAEASRMSDAELLEYIQLNTSKSIQALVPDAPSKTAVNKFSKEVESFVEERIGKPIGSIAKLRAAAAANGPRWALIRGLAGDMESKDLWRALPGGLVNAAQAVWKAVPEYGDKKMILLWVLQGSGSKGVTSDRRRAVSQPVADASKRTKVQKASKVQKATKRTMKAMKA